MSDLVLVPPTADAGVPVRKEKADYTRARWQVDAHAFWRSSGISAPASEAMADRRLMRSEPG